MTPTSRSKQRGVALPFVAIFMVVILGFTALGIDIARLAHVASEVQAVADAAARGGAMGLIATTAVNGDGIVRARLVGHENFMNGAIAPDGNIMVDEGFFDVAENKFECCTNNSPCCINKTSAPWDDICKSTAKDCTAKHKAVVAMPNTVVNNLFATIFNYIVDGRIASAAVQGANNGQTRVEKLAVAMSSGPSSACQQPADCALDDWKCYCEHGVAPCLPIAAPSCKFDCSSSGCTLPDLQVSTNNTDSAAWTGYNNNPTVPILRGYMTPTTANCSQGNNGSQVPTQTVGPDIQITNGVNGNGGNSGSTPFEIVQCLIGQQPATKQNPSPPPPQGCTIDDETGKIDGWGGTIFTIPVFQLDTCTTSMNQSWPLVGFATVEITSVTISGDTKTINIQTVANTTDTAASPGGQCFQTECSVAMMR